jgi:hypothetical protein
MYFNAPYVRSPVGAGYAKTNIGIIFLARVWILALASLKQTTTPIKL